MGGDVFVTVHLIRSKATLERYPDTKFLISKVFGDDGLIWQFAGAKFKGIGFLAMAGNEVVVALVEKKTNGKVLDVVSLSAIIEHKQLDVSSKIRMKRLAAKFLGLDFSLSDIEKKVSKIKFDQEKEKETKVRAERRHARDAKRRRIMSRKEVKGFTADGAPRHGIPVVGDEWQSLPGGKLVILVEEYDEEDNKAGELIEAFYVDRDSNPPKKGKPASVSREAKKTSVSGSGAVMPAHLKTALIDTENGMFEVMVFKTKNDIKAARAAGLNSGTYVTSEESVVEGGLYQIQSISEKEAPTVATTSLIEL